MEGTVRPVPDDVHAVRSESNVRFYCSQRGMDGFNRLRHRTRERHPVEGYTMVLPVGQPLDAMEGDDGGPDATAVVRLGRDWIDLTPQQYKLWLLAFEHYLLPDLVEAATGAGLTDVEPAIDAFRARGLFLVLSMTKAGLTRELEDALRRHRLIPTGVGLGRSTERGGTFEIAGADRQPRAWLDGDVYLVGFYGPLVPLWEACQRVAELTELHPRTVAERTLVRLPAFTSMGLGFLDTWDEQQPST